ncbi:MAG: type II secretion system protein [Verrucomicrobiales bacterium]|nr:type II secretion system protein [Verrucomicrobiales bacterium]
MKTFTQIHKKNRAFSLVEMLLIISLLGVVSKLALTAFHNTLDRAWNETSRANARMIVGLGNSAVASGIDVYGSATGVTEAANAVLGGITLDSFANGRSALALSSLSADEIDSASEFLIFEGGILRFVYSGDSGDSGDEGNGNGNGNGGNGNGNGNGNG